jgi:hypothetical protein
LAGPVVLTHGDACNLTTERRDLGIVHRIGSARRHRRDEGCEEEEAPDSN